MSVPFPTENTVQMISRTTREPDSGISRYITFIKQFFDITLLNKL